MGLANFQPSRRFGLTDNPQIATFATAGQSWTLGALVNWAAAGTISECAGNTANGVVVYTIAGIASSPFTPAITASGGTVIGQETVPAVGGGTSISAPRRAFYPARALITYIGTIDTSGSPGATGLALADLGATFALNSVNAALALVASGGTWIVNRTGTTKAAIVFALVDPPGAKTTDTPNLGAGNSGQSLVEFALLTGTQF